MKQHALLHISKFVSWRNKPQQRSTEHRDHLRELMAASRDAQSSNCIQRISELAEELDYLDDLLTEIRQTHPTEYKALINQRSSVVGDLATARKLLEKLL